MSFKVYRDSGMVWVDLFPDADPEEKLTHKTHKVVPGVLNVDTDEMGTVIGIELFEKGRG